LKREPVWKEVLILFGKMEKGIGNLVFIGRVRAALVRVFARALAIYPSRAATGVDSPSGWKVKKFFRDSAGHLETSEKIRPENEAQEQWRIGWRKKEFAYDVAIFWFQCGTVYARPDIHTFQIRIGMMT
jgi:hypothetical protein